MMADQAKIEWRGPELMKAYRKASKESIQQAATVLHKKIKADTPRSAKHRSKRKYPSGATYHEPKRLYTTCYKRVKDRGDRGILGWVSFKYGYVNLLIGKMKKQGKPNFMIKARDEVAPEILPILQRKAPK